MEDDISLREGMVELISEQASVREAGSVAEALEALREERFSLVVSDLRIGQKGEGGRIILEAARRRLQPVVIVSASSTEEVERVVGPQNKPDAELRKPFQLDDMISLVERFVRLHQEVLRVAQAGVPAGGVWTEVAPGLHTCEAPGGGQWWRMEPGRGPSSGLARAWTGGAASGRRGVLLVEGALEVEGERHVGPQYCFLSAGAREVHAPEGCLAVSLPLRA